jgi:histidinol-phosphate aminotransferase
LIQDENPFNGFFRHKGAILFPDVSYSFYPTYCRLYDILFRTIPLDAEYQIDPHDYRGPSGGIVIANPNAPTGVSIGLDAIKNILDHNPDVVVLIDEAYVDFGAESAVSLVPEYDNLLVVQTFSKSRSLAGMRVGFAVGQPHLIEGLQRIKDSFNSYPLDKLALVGALAAWLDRAWFDKTCELVVADREAVAAELQGHGFRVLPSKANFIFVSHPSVPAPQLLGELRDIRILVRHFQSERTRDWLRISIGTSEECRKLLAGLCSVTRRTAASYRVSAVRAPVEE